MSGQYVASPIIEVDKLVTASKHGKVTVIQVGDGLEVLATSNFEEEIFATTAIVDNKIYLRIAKYLYAIGG